jgi:hypothetical protein
VGTCGGTRRVWLDSRSALQTDLVDFSEFECEGYKYILSFKDYFTKVYLAMALKDKTGMSVFPALHDFCVVSARTVVDATEQTLQLYLPLIYHIQSDHGSEFIAKLYKEFADRWAHRPHPGQGAQAQRERAGGAG